MKIEANGLITHGDAVKLWQMPQPATVRAVNCGTETHLPPDSMENEATAVWHIVHDGLAPPPVSISDKRLTFHAPPLETWHVRAMHELLSRGFERCEYSVHKRHIGFVKAFFATTVASLPAVGMISISFDSGGPICPTGGQVYAAAMAKLEADRRAHSG